MRRLASWALVVGCVLALSGCMMTPMGFASAERMAAPGSDGEPVHAATVEHPKLDPERSQRLVVYNAVVRLVVERLTDSLQQIKTMAEGMGGYMQEMSGTSITVKVPANKFHEAVAAVEKLGEVVAKEIKGTDVTEQVRDLRIRLQNDEALRQRLLKLLEKSDKVEDTLKVERELTRVTESIELIKGKLQYVESQVAFSTLTVHVNSPLPQRQLETEIPFAWVRELGSDLTRGTAGRTSRGLGPLRGIKLRLPDAYIKYYEDADETRAMSADEVLVRLRRHENYKGGDLEFWATLVRRALVAQRAFALKEPSDLRLRTGVAARVLAGSKEIGGKPYGYLIAVIARKGHVYTFEAWGPQEKFAAHRAKLEAAICSIRVGPLLRLLLTLL
ncbi:MAG TPA: DUF4349 domain-containing protein [Planctomycetota bacterium]|nr:DUF4349 domain-containing protein [Planctomycetota bacterium]